MATVAVIVLENDQKTDGTWNVKIRISHQRKSAYIKTSHFIVKSQLKKDFSIKDPDILDEVNQVVADYRRQISKLGTRVDVMTAREIADYLSKPVAADDINFLAFCRGHIEQLKKEGKVGSAQNMYNVTNVMEDFAGLKLTTNDISVDWLKKFEAYLRTPRELKRPHRSGKEFTIKTAGLTDSGVNNRMRDLRLLFNAAKDKYNDEDRGIIRIPHNPFKKYKAPKKPESTKRNVDIATIKAIRDYQAAPDSRVELGRDLFMLSFYMCGMNTVDMYGMDKLTKGRLNYERAKTKGKRSDRAFISLHVPAVAGPLLKKYLGKLNKRFSSRAGLNSAVNYGLRKIVAQLGLPELEFYSARHSFATLARNECRFSKDDVAMALNHIDTTRKTTDIYLEKDWKIVDEVQAGVIALLDEKP